MHRPHSRAPSPTSSETPDVSLSALLTAAQGEGPEADAALEELLTSLCGIVRRSALHHARGLADVSDVAADVTQETLIGLAKGVRGCRATTDAEVVAWARVATRNAYIDMFRSPGSGLAARLLADELVHDMHHFAALTGADMPQRNSPAMTVLLRVLMEAYGDAVESTGELFWWRLIMSLEWTEIAAKFSTTAAGAKRRFQRAQEALRRSVLSRVEELPAAERVEVVALLQRFGYAESLTATANEGEGQQRVASSSAPADTRASGAMSSQCGRSLSFDEAAA
ncbi:MAG: sigma-70 family RNA polymerase sigma factor [Gemmatimonadaceae bacterium]|nr:sigma-70 family RNA polymerase sigma factor [Gemmatimonadaceae bacterium]